MNNPNFKYKAIISLLILVMVIATASSSWAAANTIYVSAQGNDSWNGQSPMYNTTTGDGPKATITNAINTVADNGTVYVASGTYKENLNIYIKNVNLIGADPDTTIIDGQQKNGVLYFAGWDTIHYYTLFISGLTLTNGKKDKGGGIYNDNGTIYLLNTKITANIATKEGGGIFNIGTIYADSLTIINGNIRQGSMENETDDVYGYPIIYLTPAPNPSPNNDTNSNSSDESNNSAPSDQSTTSGNSTVPLKDTGVPLAALALAAGLSAVGLLRSFKR